MSHGQFVVIRMRWRLFQMFKNSWWPFSASASNWCSLRLLESDSLQWRHNDPDGVSNRQPHGCLLNRLFRRRSKKTSKPRVAGLCAGNSPGPGPVNSPHKTPVTRKMFPFDDVIMLLFEHGVHILNLICNRGRSRRQASALIRAKLIVLNVI